MVSKRVTRRSSIAAQIASAAVSWSAATQKIVEELLGPYLEEEETMPSIAIFQQLLGRLVLDKGKKLTSGDEKLDHHLARAIHLREKRGQEADNLRQLLRTAKFYFDRLDGRGAGAKLGLGHGLSRIAPFELSRLGRQIADFLLVERKTSGALLAGLPDPVELSRSIAEQTHKLRQILDDLLPEVTLAGFHRGQQKLGLKATEKAVRRSAGLLAELYKFCDHDLLAKDIRPKFRRRSRAKKTAPPATVAAEPGILEGIDWTKVHPVENRLALLRARPNRPRGRLVRQPR